MFSENSAHWHGSWHQRAMMEWLIICSLALHISELVINHQHLWVCLHFFFFFLDWWVLKNIYIYNRWIMINRKCTEKYQCCQFIVLCLTFASIHYYRRIFEWLHVNTMTSGSIFQKYSWNTSKPWKFSHNDKSSLSVSLCVYAWVQTWKGMSLQTWSIF